MSEHPTRSVPPFPAGGLRVLVVDDHAAFRAAARAVLTAAGLEVVGEAADGTAALAQVAATQPDVVLLDIGLPDLDGFEVCARLASLTAPPAVVLTSTREAAEYRDRLAASPARGFVPKSALSADAIANLVR